MSLGQAIDNQIQQSTQDAVRKAVAPLLDEIADLKERLFEQRRVVHYRQLRSYFGGQLRPQRIKDYIRGRKLPEGVVLPLPANKIGQQYFVDTEVLERWQAGECDEKDLHEWQREKYTPSRAPTFSE